MGTFVASIAVVSSIGCAAAMLRWWQERRHCEELIGKLTEARQQCSDDVTELHRCKELDRAKDEFISTVSHELRTPLTSIRGALGLLSSGVAGQVDAKAHRLVHIASSNTDRLVRLINDLLDLQRMDAGHTLQMATMEAGDALSQAAETMRPMADGAGVRLEVATGLSGGGDSFEGDADRVQQVLCNLLSNAIKFSPRDSVIQLSCAVRERDLLLRVEDRGRGVPEEKLDTIFDRFSQVEASDAKQKGGSGLGLAICRAIVEQHGGAIWAERNGGDAPGLAVVVRLPRTRWGNDPIQVSQGRVMIMDNGRAGNAVHAEPEARRQLMA